MFTTQSQARQASQRPDPPVRRHFWGQALVVFLAATAIVSAAPLTGGNLLINTDRMLLEFTPSGDWIQAIRIPHPVSAGELPRDIVVDRRGQVLVYNGAVAPHLSCYDPVAESWSHTPCSGWTNSTNEAHGGIATYEQYAFVTDMTTADAPLCGVIRFDRDQSIIRRFAVTTVPIDEVVSTPV